MRSFVLPLALTALLSACQTQPFAYYKCERLPAERQRAAYLRKHVNGWIKEQALIKATPVEIREAQATEIPINKSKATFPDGWHSVEFTMGKLHGVKAGDTFGPQTTTSYYVLKNVRSGTVVARIQSKLFDRLLNEKTGVGRYEQKVWVSSNGRHAMIYEAWFAGDGTHAITALLSAPAEGSSWSVKYLSLPSFAPAFPGGEFEPDGVPYGFSEGMLLFDPRLMIQDESEKIYKKPINEIKGSGGPLEPFTIG